MVTFRDRLSQHTLIVEKNCQLQCLGCELWQRPSKSVSFKYLIQTQQFFSQYPKKRMYNIVGGEPLLNSEIYLLVAYLKSMGIKIRLWTNGRLPLDYYEKARMFVDIFVVYLPVYDSDLYIEKVGVGELSDLEETLTILNQENYPLVLSMPLEVDTIGFMPELYEFAYGLKVPLLFHYDPNYFQKESWKYIHRFLSINGVSVVRSTLSVGVCKSFPVSIDSFRNVMCLELANLFRRIQQFFTL